MDRTRTRRLQALVPVGPGEPGVALGVIEGGRVTLRHTAGLASLEHGAPITPTTRFHVVSVTKTFTAAAVLLLAARGRLGLDDEVSRHLPELGPASDPPTTLRHLLAMTSGLHDCLEIERLRGVWRPSRERERDLLDIAFTPLGRSFAAGARYAYCNANFVLLSEIVRRLTGMDADAFRAQEIYRPLGLARTGARMHDGLVLPGLAEGYVADGAGGWQRATELLGISGDVVVSTLDDLLAWLGAWRAGFIGEVAITRPMAERARLADGSPVHRGLGLAVRRYRGLEVLCHSGSQPGYKAHLCFVPERDVGIVVLANREEMRPAAVAAGALDVLLEGRLPAAHPRERTPVGPAAAGLAGDHVDPATGEWLSLAVGDGALVGETLGDPAVLYPDGEGGYADADDFQGNYPVRLRPAADGRIEGSLGGLACRFQRCAPPRYGADDLAAFAGLYENAAAAVAHRIAPAPDGQLRVTYGGGLDRAMTFPMLPIHPDIFRVDATAPGVLHRHLFRFERDASGTVGAVTLTLERLKGFRLDRRPSA